MASFSKLDNGLAKDNSADNDIPQALKLEIPPWMPDDLPDRVMPDLIDVYKIIDKWTTVTYAKVLQAYRFKGGWEGWAQIELAMGIQAKYKDITVTREVLVYEGSAERADLVLAKAGETTHIIELKVFSLWRFEEYGKTSFVNGFIEDIDKITQKGVRASVGPAQLHAVGLCCVDAANEWAGKKLTKLGLAGEVDEQQVVKANGVDEPAMYRWSFDEPPGSMLDADREVAKKEKETMLGMIPGGVRVLSL